MSEFLDDDNCDPHDKSNPNGYAKVKCGCPHCLHDYRYECSEDCTCCLREGGCMHEEKHG